MTLFKIRKADEKVYGIDEAEEIASIRKKSNSGKLEADRMSDQTFGNRRRVQDLLKTSGTFIK